MNILYILNSADPGGMEKHVLDLVSGMVSQGNSVFVWCPRGSMAACYQDAGAQVTDVTIKLDIDPIYIYGLTKFLKRTKIDVLHAHELKAVTNALLAGFLAKTPVRISHTHTPISEWRIGDVKKKLTVLGYSCLVNLFATREVALTESRKNAKLLEGIRELKLVVIPNGVDILDFDLSQSDKYAIRQEILTEYEIPQDAFVFGNISRMTLEKGHSILVEAFSLFVSRLNSRGQIGASPYLLLAGGGVLEEEIKSQIAMLDLNSLVKVTGVFELGLLEKFYASFDAFVFPSLAEGFGFVLVEAMASGLSVVCSDLPVLQEVGGATVMYFETGNASDLAEKLYDLYTRYDQFERLRVTAKERVRELYSLEKFVGNYVDLYKTLL